MVLLRFTIEKRRELKTKMKELDLVRLKENYKEIKKGETGTIVLLYDDKNCEVEFFDNEGDTIDVVTTPLKKLELVKSFK